MNEQEYNSILSVLISRVDELVKNQIEEHNLTLGEIGILLDGFTTYYMSRLAWVAEQIEMPEDKFMGQMARSILHALKHKVAIGEKIEGVK